MRRTFAAILLAAGMAGFGLASSRAAVTVTDVWASQDASSGRVHIAYNLAATGSGPLTITLEVSADGGVTWNVPATTLSGNGYVPPVTPGTGKLIVWDAMADWRGQVSDHMRFRVNVSDIPPAPSGMALIPAGSFQMGNALSASGDGYSNELPVHSVYVSAFYMDRYEVSKALWDEVAVWAAANGYDINAASASGKASNHPAHSVTWYEAVKWCNARSQKAGLTPCYTVSGAVYKTNNQTPVCSMSASGYRLPTEAEWEKAARGGLSGKRFPWGDTINHSYANYYNSTYFYESPQGAGYHPTYATGGSPYTSPVGSFAANGYGLYDMAGNLWEWCNDWYSSSYYSSSPSSDPGGSPSGSYRVLRGGGWNDYAYYCRVAGRDFLNPPGGINRGGFRCVRR